MKVITKITIIEKGVKREVLTDNALKEYKDSVYDYLSYEFDDNQEIKIEVEIKDDEDTGINTDPLPIDGVWGSGFSTLMFDDTE